MDSSIGRILNILETFSSKEEGGFTVAEILAAVEMPASTVYRLLSELEKFGYLYRTHDKRIHPNFTFQRNISFGSIGPEDFSEACLRVCNELQCASEVIQLRGQNLVWHLREEHPQQAFRLRAHPGFVRASNELDSIARLALGTLPIEKIASNWDTAGFFDVGVAGGKVTWADAQRQIASADPDEMQFDLQGNSKGIRRYCVSIHDELGEFLCLLTAAEAAVPMRDEEAHVERIRSVLNDTRQWLMSRSKQSENNKDIKKVTG